MNLGRWNPEPRYLSGPNDAPRHCYVPRRARIAEHVCDCAADAWPGDANAGDVERHELCAVEACSDSGEDCTCECRECIDTRRAERLAELEEGV